MRRRPANQPAGPCACAALLVLALQLLPGLAVAGSIGFRTDAEVTAGPGVDAKVTMTHTGDEEAEDVSVQAELLDRTIDGAQIKSMRPGQSEVWNFHLFDEIPRGIYAIVLRARYADGNGYPFEIVSTAAASVGVKPAPRIFGSIDLPRLAPGGRGVATLKAKRPPERSGDFEVRLIAPSGLEVKPDRAKLVFDPSGRATVDFNVRNLKLLDGTTVNLFGFVTGTSDGVPQTDTIRGNVRIAASAPRVTSPMFYQTAGALLLLLLALEGYAWARGERRA